MVVVRGLNLFPTMIAGVLNRLPELSGEYRIVLGHPPPYDALAVQAELAPGHESDLSLAAAVEAEIKRTLGASAQVTLLAPHSLPRTEGKTRRIVRYDP